MSKTQFSLESIEEILSGFWRIDKSAGPTLCVHGVGSRAYIHTELERENTFRVLIDYSDVEFAKKLLEKIADNPYVTVDNDFGTILSGDQFVARIRSDNQWNWDHYSEPT